MYGLYHKAVLCFSLWKQDDTEDSETDGDEEDGSQSSTNQQAASRFHRYVVTIHESREIGQCVGYLNVPTI